MSFFDPEEANYMSDYIPDTLDDLKNLLYINSSTARNALNSMSEFIYSTNSYIEFKTPSIYESQNYDYLSGDSYNIPSMNYSVTAINDILKQEQLITSSFEGNTYKQFKIRASNTNRRDTIREYLKELTIGLSDAEVDEMVIYDIDDSKYINITDPNDFQFVSLFGYTNGADYFESILIDDIKVPLGKSILLQGKSNTETVGNDSVTFDKHYLYNQVQTSKQSIFKNLLLSTDLTADTDAIDGSDSINDDYLSLTNLENYRIYAIMIVNSDDEMELKYRIVRDEVYNTLSTDYNEIVTNKKDYYEYYNSKTHPIIEGYLNIEGVYAIALIGGFHYGFNRSNKQVKEYQNVVGMKHKETYIVPSDNTKTASVREYVKNIHSNVVFNSIWDNYIRPVSCPVNMVRIEDEFIDIYCLDKNYIPVIKTKNDFSNTLLLGENAVDKYLAKNTFNKTVIENHNIFDINNGMFCYYSDLLNSKGFDNVLNNEEGTYYYNGSNIESKYNTASSNIFTYLGSYITKTDAVSFLDFKPYSVGYGYTTTREEPFFEIDYKMLNTNANRASTVIRLKSNLK